MLSQTIYVPSIMTIKSRVLCDRVILFIRQTIDEEETEDYLFQEFQQMAERVGAFLENILSLIEGTCDMS